MKSVRMLLSLLAVGACLVVAGPAEAVVNHGTGTANLQGNFRGGDLTDLNNDGNEGAYAPPNLAGFDAEFFSSNEPGFGGGEFAFNVFDNVLSGGNGKWCCGGAAPQIVGADFSNTLVGPGQGIVLTSFTVSSANDVPDRDPRVWRMQGSNDGNTWDTIFEQNDPQADVWGSDRFEVLEWVAGADYASPQPYSMFRMVTDSTGLTGGAFFQIGEIELFGRVASTTQPGVPEPATAALGLIGLAALGLRRRKRA